jgi:hypothetical protein
MSQLRILHLTSQRVPHCLFKLLVCSLKAHHDRGEIVSPSFRASVVEKGALHRCIDGCILDVKVGVLVTRRDVDVNLEIERGAARAKDLNDNMVDIRD